MDALMNTADDPTFTATIAAWIKGIVGPAVFSSTSHLTWGDLQRLLDTATTDLHSLSAVRFWMSKFMQGMVDIGTWKEMLRHLSRYGTLPGTINPPVPMGPVYPTPIISSPNALVSLKDEQERTKAEMARTKKAFDLMVAASPGVVQSLLTPGAPMAVYPTLVVPEGERLVSLKVEQERTKLELARTKRAFDLMMAVSPGTVQSLVTAPPSPVVVLPPLVELNTVAQACFNEEISRNTLPTFRFPWY
eukprot:TRINITY_DN60917_c0_g1_i1.p1 TRINITY_DN60917_c0_g1~~TRINITY_DN60917_c0_g1_i1.p1  ORF type:complete len:247 (-),score=21.49 TRINITY_DN60917_c0_g1_i1:103-843(-)